MSRILEPDTPDDVIRKFISLAKEIMEKGIGLTEEISSFFDGGDLEQGRI